MFLRRKVKSTIQASLHSLLDEDIVNQYKKSGDTQFIGELFERYTHLVFGLCMKYLKDEDESKDAVMQIFEDLHVKLKEHKIANFKNWLWSVATNHCLMLLRKKKSTTSLNENYYQKIHTDVMEMQLNMHPINSAESEDPIPTLMKGMETLKNEQRICLELLYLQNKSYREVSDITGYSMKKVKSHIQNGKRNLRNYIERK